MKKNINDWKPYFLIFGKNAFSKEYPEKRNIEYYERSWYCFETSIIHNSEKSVLKCKYCSLNYYKK